MSDVNKPYPMIYTRVKGSDVYFVALNPGKKKVEATIGPLSNKYTSVIQVGKTDWIMRKDKQCIIMGGISAAVFKVTVGN